MDAWTEAPDHVGVVLAARAWRARRGPGGPELVSVTRDVPWPHRHRLEARCVQPQMWFFGARTVPPTHEAPQLGCQCGIWGLCHGGTVVAEHRSPAYVFGVVALWGPVLAGPYGWRGRYAYPQALVRVGPPPPPLDPRGRRWGPPPPLEELAAAYGVSVLDDWPTLTPARGDLG